MPEQEEHSAARRQQIIDGAERVFTESGYEGASMSRIAQQAAVSKGTLYNYFAGKSELFAAFVSQKAGSTLAQVFEPFAEQEDTGHALRQIALRMIALMLSPGSLVLYRIVVAEAGTFPHLAQIFWETGPQRALAHMAGWLTQQMQAGRLRRADPDLAAAQFFALCQIPCMKRRLQLVPDVSQDEIDTTTEGAVRLFLDSYGLPRHRAPQHQAAEPAPKPLAATAPER